MAIYPALAAPRAIAAEDSPRESAPAEVPAFELEEMTIDQLQADMKSGKYTARSLTEKYLQRIQNVDKHGPAVNSVIEINPEQTPLSSHVDLSLRGAAGEILPRLIGTL